MQVETCCITPLPPELAAEAARVAVEINPANAVPAAVVMHLALVAPSPVELVMMVDKKWKAPVRLPVQFVGDGWTAECKRMVLDRDIGANDWGHYCDVEFVETTQTGVIRVARSGRGYSSLLGTDALVAQPPAPTLNLGGFTAQTPVSEYKRVVKHEFGHALGFHHEQLRPEIVADLDPAKCYAYFERSQGWSRAMVDANVLTPLKPPSAWLLTDPDRRSIMCYTLGPDLTYSGKGIPGGADIDTLDGAGAARVYPGVRFPSEYGPGTYPGDVYWSPEARRLWWWNDAGALRDVGNPYPGFGGSVYVAANRQFVVTGAGPGGGPHGVCWDRTTGAMLWSLLIPGFDPAGRNGAFPWLREAGGQLSWSGQGGLVVEMDPLTGVVIGSETRNAPVPAGQTNYRLIV